MLRTTSSKRGSRFILVLAGLAAAAAACLTACGGGGVSGGSSETAPPEEIPGPQIWRPAPGTSWQWQLSGPIAATVDAEMFDLDLFETPQSTIDELHRRGRIVVCYLSAGTWEDWRPDSVSFPAEVKGAALEDYPDERWLDIRRLDILGPILNARLDLARAKDCDGVEPDNVDAFDNNSGFPLTAEDQLRFNIWLAEQAHARGLSVGLKNDIGQAASLAGHFDWALNEQCFEYEECEMLLPFTAAGKAVFGVEYAGDPAVFCPQANALNFDWLKKNPELDAYRIACR